MGSEVEQLNTLCAQVYTQMSLKRIYIDFTVVAAAATVIESSSAPTLLLEGAQFNKVRA